MSFDYVIDAANRFKQWLRSGDRKLSSLCELAQLACETLRRINNDPDYNHHVQLAFDSYVANRDQLQSILRPDFSKANDTLQNIWLILSLEKEMLIQYHYKPSIAEDLILKAEESIEDMIHAEISAGQFDQYRHDTEWITCDLASKFNNRYLQESTIKIVKNVGLALTGMGVVACGGAVSAVLPPPFNIPLAGISTLIGGTTFKIAVDTLRKSLH
jgi:hypothetical protein